MSVGIIADNREVGCKLVQFSDGAVNIQVDPEPLYEARNFICITIRPDTPVSSYREVISLVVNILDEHAEMGCEWILHLPYFPNARADRKFDEGMPIPLISFVDFLQNLPFDKIVTKDVHNIAPIEGVKLVNQSQLSCFHETMSKINRYLVGIEDNLLCSPDAGAREKARTISDYYNCDLITATKNRDVSTGWIKSVELDNPDIVIGRDVVIVDDICDGGATFLKLAEKLRDSGAKSITLYVTHGIFSKGLDIFKGVVDNVYCNQIVMSYVTETDINKFNGGL